jgi:hypothetical protein
MLDTLMQQATQDFNENGMIEATKKKGKGKDNLYLSLAEMIRQQGKGEDTILAHINPLEAMMLKEMGGSGKINPTTGLPQFGFLKNPFKAIKSLLGGVGGTVIGNMIAPGVGGIVGGALGGAAGSAIRGRKDFAQSALRGGLLGAALPTAAGLAGSGANALGMDSAGQYLTDYGSQNAVMPSLGRMIGDNSAGNYIGSIGQSTGSSEGALENVAKKGDKSWFSSLIKPKNLLTAATVAGSFMNRPKEKSPERLADEQKRFSKASILSPQERAAQEAELIAEEQMKRRVARNRYLPEDRFEVKPLYRTVNSPAEYARTGKWLNYYDNPQMHGNPLLMKKGGLIPEMIFESEEIDSPFGNGVFLDSHIKGQDDKIPILTSGGEMMIPSDVVSHIGDGNSNAGGAIFHRMIKNVRADKGMKNKLPPRAKDLETYMQLKKQRS